MKNGSYFALFLVAFSVGLIAMAVLLQLSNHRLRADLKQKCEECKKAVTGSSYMDVHAGTYAEDLMFIRSCNDILAVVSNGRCAALRDYADVISRSGTLPRIGCCGKVEGALAETFYDSFLRRNTHFKKFENLVALESYLRINFDLMVHYGGLDIRNGDWEVLSAKEYLALKTLNYYKRKFQDERNAEFEHAVDSCLKLLIEHIESPYGFTRISARHMIWMNTDLANAMKPGKGVSRESAMKIGRAVAQGLVRCGYTPKWLDEEFPIQKTKASE